MIWWTLHRLKSSSPARRAAAARKLGESGSKKGVPALLEALGDDAPKVRIAAAGALAKLTHPAAAEPLAAAMERAATCSLGKMETGSNEFQALADAMTAQGKAALKPLEQLLASQHKDARLWAARALGSIGGPDAAEALAGLLEDRRSDVRREGALAIGKIADPSSAAHLAKALSNRDPETRRAAAEALGSLNSTLSLDALEAATRDSDESVQRAAVASIVRVGTAAAALRLKAALESERKGIREAAAAAISSPSLEPRDENERAGLDVLRGNFDAAAAAGETALAHLIDALHSRDAARRSGAARALRGLRSPASVPELLRLLRDQAPEAREAATDTLAAVGVPAVAHLMEALASEDPLVQRHAAAVLGRIGDPKSAAALVDVISRHRQVSLDYTDPLEAARTAAEALLAILGANAASVSRSDLECLSTLPDVSVEKATPENPWVGGNEIMVDCTPLRDLARKELIRRQG